MKKGLFFILFCTVAAAASSQDKNFLSDIYNYLENTQVFELNQE